MTDRTYTNPTIEAINAKLRAVRLREYLPPSAIETLRKMPYEYRRLHLHQLRAIIAGLI